MFERSGSTWSLLLLVATILVATPAACLADRASPPSAGALLQDGEALYEQGRYREALAAFGRAVEVTPDSVDAHYFLAVTAVYVPDRKRGLEAIEAILRIDPGLADNEGLRRVRAELEALSETANVAVRVPAPRSRTAEEALAIRTAERILARGTQAEGAGDLKRIGEEAYAALREMLLDPTLEDIEVWRVAAAISIYTKDDVLAAHAFSAIRRLRPEFHSDPQLLDLMAELNRPAVQEVAAVIDEKRGEVLSLYRRAMAGDSESMFQLASAYRRGEVIVRDADEAVRWIERSAETSYPDALHEMGNIHRTRMLQGGSERAKHCIAAVRYFRKAVEGGRADSMRPLMIMLMELNPRDPEVDQEIDRWLRSSKVGVTGPGMFLRGFLADSGVESLRNIDSAVLSYQRAYELGELDAIVPLGRRIRVTGLPTTSLRDKALFEWIKAQALRGDPDAMTTLGSLYQNGMGVARDEAEGFRWIKRAADLGYAPALNNLGLCYSSGRGVARSPELAYQAYRWAADLNVPNAGAWLLRHYESESRQRISGDLAIKAAFAAGLANSEWTLTRGLQWYRSMKYVSEARAAVPPSQFRGDLRRFDDRTDSDTKGILVVPDRRLFDDRR